MLHISRRNWMALALACAVNTGAYADNLWPQGSIRLISPYAPGGDNDSTARILGQHLAEALGTSVVVENKAGAATIIASEQLVKSAPDGRTLLWGAATHTSNPAIYDKLPFDPIADFSPVIHGVAVPLVVVVSADSPVRTVKDLVEGARRDPAKGTMASAGNGSRAHFAIESLAGISGVDLTHVPYKGSSQALTDVVGGRVAAGVHGLGVVSAQLQAGKLRPIAVVASRRLEAFPEVPTMAESGYPGADLEAWFGLFAPKSTPPEVVARLNSEANRILQLPDVIERYAALGAFPVGGSAEGFQAFIREDLENMAQIAKQRNIQISR